MDLNSCKEIMYEGDYRCVVADEQGVLFVSKGKGMDPMLELVDEIRKNNWHPRYQADRILGKAAVLVASECGMMEMYGDVVSQSAFDLSVRRNIRVEYGSLVPRILNRTQTDEGPFEKALHNVDETDFEAVLSTIRTVADNMRSQRTSGDKDPTL